MTNHDWESFRSIPFLATGEVRRIVVFRALHLGDFLCSVPALRALRERYPWAELTLIGLPWLRDLLDRYPCVDRFLEFPGYWGLEGVLWDPDRTRAFLEDARAYRYDLAIQMHGDGQVSNGFVAQLGARASLGYRPEALKRRPELQLELDQVAGEHEILRWLRLVGALRATGGTNLEFPLLPGDWVEADAALRLAGADLEKPLLVLHPGAKETAKRWPEERFAEAANRLAGELEAQVIVTGTRAELSTAQRVAEGVRGGAFVLAGKTSLGDLAALLARARLVLTNDTGPSHLAAAVGAPSVVIFGPTDPARWGPLDGSAHRSVWSGPGVPIFTIPVERVVEEALALVERCAYLTF